MRKLPRCSYASVPNLSGSPFTCYAPNRRASRRRWRRCAMRRGAPPREGRRRQRQRICAGRSTSRRRRRRGGRRAAGARPRARRLHARGRFRVAAQGGRHRGHAESSGAPSPWPAHARAASRDTSTPRSRSAAAVSRPVARIPPELQARLEAELIADAWLHAATVPEARERLRRVSRLAADRCSCGASTRRGRQSPTRAPQAKRWGSSRLPSTPGRSWTTPTRCWARSRRSS